MFLPKKSLKFEIPQNFIQSSLSLENQSTCSSPWGQVSVVTIIKPKKETGQVHAIVIPLDKTGMVQSMLQVALGFQLENKLLLSKGKPNHKTKMWTVTVT